MSQRFLFEEDYRWPVKVMRSVIWSGTMGFVWLVPFLFLVLISIAYLDFMESRSPPPEEDLSGLAIIFYFAAVLACAIVSFLSGAIIGFSRDSRLPPKNLCGLFGVASFDWAAIIFAAVFGLSVAALVGLIPHSIF